LAGQGAGAYAVPDDARFALGRPATERDVPPGDGRPATTDAIRGRVNNRRISTLDTRIGAIASGIVPL